MKYFYFFFFFPWVDSAQLSTITDSHLCRGQAGQGVESRVVAGVLMNWFLLLLLLMPIQWWRWRSLLGRAVWLRGKQRCRIFPCSRSCLYAAAELSENFFKLALARAGQGASSYGSKIHHGFRSRCVSFAPIANRKNNGNDVELFIFLQIKIPSNSTTNNYNKGTTLATSSARANNRRFLQRKQPRVVEKVNCAGASETELHN